MDSVPDLHLHSVLLFFPLGLARVISGTLRGVLPVGVLDGDRSLWTLEGVTDSPSNRFFTSSSTSSGFSYKITERKLFVEKALENYSNHYNTQVSCAMEKQPAKNAAAEIS